MMRRSIFVLCFVTLLSGFAAAQAKTVTNADLEKFRQKREAGERNLKAYYAKKGMTAADVARQEAEDAEAREQLSARLRSERLEREWLEQERMEREMAPPQVNVYVPQQERNNNGYFVYENQYNPYYPYFPNYDPYGVQRNRGYEAGPRYRATPMGIILESGGTPVPVSPQRNRTRAPGWRRPR
jgi:hypothetical protein